MTNPLLNGPASGGGSGPMNPGDVRTFHGTDKHGTIVKTIHVHRTERDYAFDLCDAYNAACTRDDLEYYVDGNMQVRMGTPHDAMMARLKYAKANAERERRRWIANHRTPYQDAAE